MPVINARLESETRIQTTGVPVSGYYAKARLCSRRVDVLQKLFLREDAEAQVPCNRIIFCKEADRGCRRPVILKSSHEIVGFLTFTLVSNDQGEKHLSLKISPPRFVPLLDSGLKRSLAAGWFGCGTRVSHFDRTGEFRVPQSFRDLTHRS